MEIVGKRPCRISLNTHGGIVIEIDDVHIWNTLGKDWRATLSDNRMVGPFDSLPIAAMELIQMGLIEQQGQWKGTPARMDDLEKKGCNLESLNEVRKVVEALPDDFGKAVQVLKIVLVTLSPQLKVDQIT